MKEKGIGIFSKDFTIEDLILYVFGIGFMVFLAFFLIQVQEQLNLQTLNNTNENRVQNSVNPVDPNVHITQLKYEYAGKILLSNSTRKNIAFLVGTILAIFGCMIVIRGVRDSPIEGELSTFEKAKIKVKTSSPGLMIVLCGCVIVALSIFVKDKYDIRDPYILENSDGIQTNQILPPFSDDEKAKITKSHNINKQK